MKSLSKLFLCLVLLVGIVPVLNLQSIYAATNTVTASDVESDSDLPKDCYYFTSSTTYVYKNTNGTCSGDLQLSDLAKSVKKSFYKTMLDIGSETKRFQDTAILGDVKYSSSSADSKIGAVSPFITHNITKYCYGKNAHPAFFAFKADGKQYKFYIPKGSIKGEGADNYSPKEDSSNSVLRNQGIIYTNSNSGIESIIVAIKEGLIAGNIEVGFNVGSVYSESQLSLNDAMEASNTSNANDTETAKATGLFKFKDSLSFKATMDYFMCPLFGRINLEDLPKSDDDWNAKVNDMASLISGGTLEINQGYLDFIDKNNTNMSGIQDAGNLKFTNGVKAYKDEVTTQEPKQKVNYNMRVAVPMCFSSKLGDDYKLKSDGLYIIPDIRMSIYNDIIYKEETEGTLTKVCTNADLQLDRSYLAFYNQKIDGQPVGVVVVLRYEEGVIDTTDAGKLYLTGRRIAFGGNYSSSLKLNTENKDSLYVTTKTSGKQAILPRNFAFNPSGGDTTDKHKLYSDSTMHDDVEKAADEFVFYIDFLTVSNSEEKDADSNKEKTSEDSYSGFVIVRNNYYINDGYLLNWLASDEAKAMTYVEASSLREKIKGEFNIEPITYSDWEAMQDVKAELNQHKNGFLIHLIRVLSIIFGTLLIILAILFILAYWFDIFNTFTDLSILHLISGKNMYPITDTDSIRYVSEYEGKTKFVTFKQILMISCVCCFIGFIFLNVTELIDFLFSIYSYIMNTFGARK